MKYSARSKAVSIVAAAGLTLSLCPFTAAMADTAETKGFVTAAATRAAQPAPEILGLSGVEETAVSWVDINNLLQWNAPKYYLMGTSEYNSNPNPFFYNYLYGGADATKVVLNEARAGAGGPSAALGEYGADETDDDVWNMLPDVIVGTKIKGGNVDYDTNPAYGPAVAQANNVDYHPQSINYVNTLNADMINTMWDIAEAGDEVAETTGKQLRYGSAKEIARAYESYVRGTQGYILSQIAAGTVPMRTVASVTGYDAAAASYTITTSGIQEGTASTNRYLEAAEGVANNLANVLGTETVTADQLATADVILIGSQSDVTPEEVVASLPAEVQKKCYFVSSANGSAGSMYGVVMNSVENAQNIGRILGCLYPEVVDQDDWMCYYYDNFYHIKADKLADAIDNAMDGVRNWDAEGTDLTSWTTADAATYNEAAVQAKIDAGMSYIMANLGSVPSTLVPTDEWQGKEDPTPSAGFPDVSESDWAYNEILAAAENGLISGYDNGNFGPYDGLTRAQAAAILWRYFDPAAAGSYDAAVTSNETGMSDVASNAWYTGAANWAAANGVINGVDNGDGTRSFNPDGMIDRGQLCAIVANAAKVFAGAQVEGSDASKLNAMPDAADVPSYFQESVAWSLNNGVINGVNEGGTRYVRPGTTVDRGTMAAVMMNSIRASII